MVKRNLVIGINLLLCCLFLADAYLLPAKDKKVTVSKVDSKLTRYKNRSYYNYFMQTTGNEKYEVSESMYRELQENDTIRIFSSPLIHMPRAIQYERFGHQERYKIGQLNSKGSLKIGLIISLLISVYLFISNLVKPAARSKLNNGLQILAVGISITVFLFVMIEIWSK
jgi:hypothetical protein